MFIHFPMQTQTYSTDTVRATPQNHVPMIIVSCLFALAVVVVCMVGSGKIKSVYSSGRSMGTPTVHQSPSVSGILPVAHGGTCCSSYTVGDLLYASPSQMSTPEDKVRRGGGV